MSTSIAYKKGYKYQLYETYYHDVPLACTPKVAIKTDYIELDTNGYLTINKGYAWDGPSGPAIDTPSFMRGSLVHDALYQLLRMGLLEEEDVMCGLGFREVSDVELHRICIEDKMWRIRAWWVFRGVRTFAASAADQRNLRKVFRAPKEYQCTASTL